MRIGIWAGMALCLVLLVGCRQEMAQQPGHAPLAGSDFFADGRSSRDLVPGTVPRGQEPLEAPLETGTASGEEVSGTSSSGEGATIPHGRNLSGSCLVERAPTWRCSGSP